MASKTHTAIALTSPGTLGAVELPTRSPGPDEVQFEVHFAAYSAADGHAVDDGFYATEFPTVVGLSSSGKVLEVGSNVDWLKPGDLVGAFTQPGGDRGTQKIITIASNRVAKIPDNVKEEDVAAVIDNFVCAWWLIKNSWGLPLPDSLPSKEYVPAAIVSSPILIWGGGTGAAIYTIQALKFAGFTNIITTASARTAPDTFAFGATYVFDYNDPDVVEKIKWVAGSEPVRYALDPVCTKASLQKVSEVVTEPGSRVAILIPIKVGDLATVSEGGWKLLSDFPSELNPFGIGVEPVVTRTFLWESNSTLKANLLRNILPYLLEHGRVRPQKIQLINEGSLLERVQKAAELVRTNKLGGAKAVVDFRA